MKSTWYCSSDAKDDKGFKSSRASAAGLLFSFVSFWAFNYLVDCIVNPVLLLLQVFTRNFNERAKEKERIKEKAKEKEKKTQQKKKKANDLEGEKRKAAAFADKQVL